MPVQNDRMQKLWEEFKRACIHQSVPEPIVNALQMAFYGGATVLFKELLNMMTPGNECTQDDLENMTNINNELMNYRAKLKAGKDWIGVQGLVN